MVASGDGRGPGSDTAESEAEGFLRPTLYTGIQNNIISQAVL